MIFKWGCGGGAPTAGVPPLHPIHISDRIAIELQYLKSVSTIMVKITLEVPDELSKKLTELGDRLPELLSQSLESHPLPTRVYRYILSFLASNPTIQEVAEFRPTAEMQERLQTLLLRNQAGTLAEIEQRELDEYERIEHLIVMLKAGNLKFLKTTT
jgi:hypothetical protein